MTVDTILLLTLSSLMITIFCLRAWKRSTTAIQWGKHEQDLVRNDEVEGPDALAPHPLADRESLLKHLKDTALVEGDVGAFILHRQEVPQQSVAGHTATLLVSVAICFTVVGMIFTMNHFATFVVSGAQTTGGTDANTALFAAMGKAMSGLPWLFAPTALGLALAVVLLKRQRDVDEVLESAWEAIDRHTKLHLLQKHIHSDAVPNPYAELSLAATSFGAAAGELRTSAGGIQGAVLQLSTTASGLDTTFGGIRETIDQLKMLDQSRWAQALIDAANTFHEKATLAGTQFSRSAEIVRSSIAGFPDAAIVFQTGTERVQGLAGALEDAAVLLRDSQAATREELTTLTKAVAEVSNLQARVASLRDDIEMLGAAIQGLNTGIGSYERSQQETVGGLRSDLGAFAKSVMGIHDALNAISTATVDFSRQLDLTMSKTQSGFDETRTNLEKMLELQRAELNGFAEKLWSVFRQTHVQFVEDLRGQLDQGHDLFIRLERLSQAIETNAGAVGSLDHRMSRSEEILNTLKDALGDVRLALRENQSAMQGVQGSVDQFRDSTAARAEQEKQQAAVLQSTLGDLQSLARRIESDASSVKGFVAGCESQVTQSRNAMEAAGRTTETAMQQLDDRLARMERVFENTHQLIQTSRNSSSPWWKRLLDRVLRRNSEALYASAPLMEGQATPAETSAGMQPSSPKTEAQGVLEEVSADGLVSRPPTEIEALPAEATADTQTSTSPTEVEATTVETTADTHTSTPPTEVEATAVETSVESGATTPPTEVKVVPAEASTNTQASAPPEQAHPLPAEAPTDPHVNAGSVSLAVITSTEMTLPSLPDPATEIIQAPTITGTAVSSTENSGSMSNASSFADPPTLVLPDTLVTARAVPEPISVALDGDHVTPVWTRNTKDPV